MTQSDYSEALSEGLLPLLDKLDESVYYAGLSVQLQGGLLFFLGVLSGLVFMLIFWGRFK